MTVKISAHIESRRLRENDRLSLSHLRINAVAAGANSTQYIISNRMISFRKPGFLLKMLLQKTVALDGSVQPAADKFGIATRWTFDKYMGWFSAFRKIDAEFCRDGIADQNRHFFGKLRMALIGS